MSQAWRQTLHTLLRFIATGPNPYISILFNRSKLCSGMSTTPIIPKCRPTCGAANTLFNQFIATSGAEFGFTLPRGTVHTLQNICIIHRIGNPAATIMAHIETRTSLIPSQVQCFLCGRYSKRFGDMYQGMRDGTIEAEAHPIRLYCCTIFCDRTPIPHSKPYPPLTGGYFQQNNWHLHLQGSENCDTINGDRKSAGAVSTH